MRTNIAITGLAVAVLTLVSVDSAQATVWRVRQNYTGGGSGGYNNMIDYIEPAAVTADAAFGGTTANDTWNSWDVDVRQGNMGGYNYIQGVATTPWVGGGSGYSTLYDGTGTANPVTIKSTTNASQHSPWYGLPTSGSGFNQLLGDEHSAGINGNSQSSTYTVQIGGLTAGDYLFYTYAHRLTGSFGRTDVPAGYYLTLNGGTETYVARSAGLAEGDAGTGVLIPFTVTGTTLDIVYTQYAGFTGPAFQFANAEAAVPEPSTFVLGALGLLGLGFVALRKKFRRA